MYFLLHSLHLLYNVLLTLYCRQRLPDLFANPSRLSQRVAICVALFLSAIVTLLELPLLAYYTVSDKPEVLDGASITFVELTYISIYIVIGELCVQIIRYFQKEASHDLRKSLPIIFLLHCTGIPVILIYMQTPFTYFGATSYVGPFIIYYVGWLVGLGAILYENHLVSE